MRIQALFTLFLLLTLVACKPIVFDSPKQAPILAVTLSPVVAVSTFSSTTFTPRPSPTHLFTTTPTLNPTEFYEQYLFDWLISKEADTHRREILQAGSHLLFTSKESPDAPDSFTDLDLSLYTEGINDFKLSFRNGALLIYQLVPISDTKVIPVDFSIASLETCINADYSSSLDFILVEAEQGNYFCAITSDRRFSLVHIDQVNHLGDGSLRMSFVTYKKDSDE